jgi:hypothetical protein
MHGGKCITVFSAANYCGDSTNPGAVMVFEEADNMDPIMAQFKAAHYRPPCEQTAAQARSTVAPPRWRAKVSSPPHGVAEVCTTLTTEASTCPEVPISTPVVAQPAQTAVPQEEAAQVLHPAPSAPTDSAAPAADAVCPFTPWLRAGLSLTPAASARIALRLQLQSDVGIIHVGAARTGAHVNAGLRSNAACAGQESKETSMPMVSCP